jgi:hypothetical protein
MAPFHNAVDLRPNYKSFISPAALPGAFTPAGAPGLLKKFDQNFS